jgi:hypothetical protein
MSTYKIIRFHRDKQNEVISRGLTLQQAKEHCASDDSKGADYFDGFTDEEIG